MTAGSEKTGGVFTGSAEDFYGPRMTLMTLMVADRSSQQAGALGGVDEADF